MKKPYKLSNALSDFVEWGSGHFSPRTVDTYHDLLKRFIKHVGDKPVSLVNITHISKYALHLKRGGYAQASQSLMLVSLRSFFKYLFERRVIEWHYGLIRIPKNVSKHHPTVRREEVLAMMQSVQTNDFIGLRDKAILSFLYATGIRVSELCDLDMEDIDTEQMRGSILNKKSSKRRVIFWDPVTNGILSKYLLEREKWATDEFVFISMDTNRKYRGGRLTTRSVQRIVKKYRIDRRVVPHSFRSGLLTDMLEAGSNIKIIQKAAGHSSINSLDPYARVSDPLLESEYRRIRG